MKFLWLMFALLPAAPAPRPVGAAEVAYFNFPEARGRTIDKPDGWRREIQPGYPFYVDAELTREAVAAGGRSLVFKLNGGACAYFSPPIPASSDYNYVAQGQIKTAGLVNDQAMLLLEFLDERFKLIGRQLTSESVGGTADWTLARIGPSAPPGPATRYLRLACLSLPGPEKDLSGKVYFDDLWVGRLPRYDVVTSAPYRIFNLPDPKVARVRVSGVEGRNYNARFYLSDENSRPLAEHVASLENAPDGARVAEWTLPIDNVGYFHLEIGLNEGSRRILLRDYPITVVRPNAASVDGEFGLSAPALGPGMTLAHYDRLLEASRSHWLKLPLWAEADNSDELSADNRALARFVERIQIRGHEVVGALARAPSSVLANLPRQSVGIADVFLLPTNAWERAIESVMARRGLEVTHWQLGGDEDVSFEGVKNLPETIERVRRQMSLIGRDVRIGLAWNWMAPVPRDAGLAFLSMTDGGESLPGARDEAAPLSSDQLRDYLDFEIERLAQPPPPADPEAPPRPYSSPQVWAQIRPASGAVYERRDQILDLARRVIAAKVGRASGIFATRLFDPAAGLVAEDGAPTELFTIWRTLAEHLGGAEGLGTLFIPGVGENYVFRKGEHAVVALRSATPMSCDLIAGRGARAVDLWGREVTLSASGDTQKVSIGAFPVLVAGIREPLARFQLGVRFLKGRLSSEYGAHTDTLEIQNPFPATLSGRVRVLFPAPWRARPETIDLQIAPFDRFLAPIAFDIPQGAPQGDLVVPLDFVINVDRPYRFRLPRPYRLGGDEVQIVATARLAGSGELDVELNVTNLTDRPMSLRCYLRAYRRAVQEAFLPDLSSRETSLRRFTLPRGAELLGSSLEVNLEQVGARRQFTVNVPVRANPEE